MEFKRKTETVYAKRLAEGVAVDGEVLAMPGDWLVTSKHGERLFCKADIFVREYEPMSGPNPANQLSP
jgi:hypothetical protein